MRKRWKWKIWEHVNICVFLSYSEAHWFPWNIELTGLPVSPTEQAAAAEKGHFIAFGFVCLYFNTFISTNYIQQYTVVLALWPLHTLQDKGACWKITKPLLSCACFEWAMNEFSSWWPLVCHLLSELGYVPRFLSQQLSRNCVLIDGPARQTMQP